MLIRNQRLDAPREYRRFDNAHMLMYVTGALRARARKAWSSMEKAEPRTSTNGFSVPLLLSLKRNQRFDDVIFLCLHHPKRPLDLSKGEAMRRQRRGIDPPVFQQP